jgi:hypothetical protein
LFETIIFVRKIFVAMEPAMLSPSHEFEIFRSIIQRVPITMMNNFPTFQGSPNHAFHNPTMFGYAALMRVFTGGIFVRSHELHSLGEIRVGAELSAFIQ